MEDDALINNRRRWRFVLLLVVYCYVALDIVALLALNLTDIEDTLQHEERVEILTQLSQMRALMFLHPYFAVPILITVLVSSRRKLETKEIQVNCAIIALVGILALNSYGNWYAFFVLEALFPD